VRYVEHAVAVSRRIDLFVREYRPAVETERTLVILHGASEHSGRHRHVAERLCSYGWRVLTPDLRGHGRSGGRSMHLGRFSDYVGDLAAVYDRFELQPESTAQIGHSMGGLATIRFAQTHAGRVSSIALSSPLLGLAVKVPPVLLASGRVLSVTYPWKRFRSVVNPADVTRSAESIAERQSDPLYRRTVTAGWFFAVQSAMRDAWKFAASLSIPVLVVQAGEDRIVDGEASRAWIATVASNDTRFHELPGRFHELHYEEDWPKTAFLYHRWLSGRLNTPRQESSYERLAA
jgi:lysophospholipase